MLGVTMTGAPKASHTAIARAVPPPPSPVAPPGFDLTGYSTFALAIVTFSLALVAFWQALLSRRAIIESKSETERSFKFESLHQIQMAAPIIIAEASSKKPDAYRYLTLRNVGQGPAINVRFSGTVAGEMFSAAQYSAAAVGAGGMTQTTLALSRNYEARERLLELEIRYEDIFGNVYSTEYQRFEEDSEWYTWRRPWLGKDLGLTRPPNCSEDPPEWGFNGRMYYDAQKGLY